MCLHQNSVGGAVCVNGEFAGTRGDVQSFEGAPLLAAIGVPAAALAPRTVGLPHEVVFHVKHVVQSAGFSRRHRVRVPTWPSRHSMRTAHYLILGVVSRETARAGDT